VCLASCRYLHRIGLDSFAQFGRIQLLIEKNHRDKIISSSARVKNLGCAIKCNTINFFGINDDKARKTLAVLEAPKYVFLHGENCAESFGI
jgi:hypothetical protein